jgi:hypothetical protein
MSYNAIERRLAALENTAGDGDATGQCVLVLPPGLSAEQQAARIAERAATLPTGATLYVLPDNGRDPR